MRATQRWPAAAAQRLKVRSVAHACQKILEGSGVVIDRIA